MAKTLLKVVFVLVLSLALGTCGGGGGDSPGGGGSTPAVSVTAATSITGSGATLNGLVTPNGLATAAWFEWGTDSSLATCASTATQSIGDGYDPVGVVQDVSGCNAATTYYYRICGSNTRGTTRSAIASFSTSTAAPTASTLAATSVTATGAVLNGSVIPNGEVTTAWFEWGTDPWFAAASVTPAQNIGSGIENVSVNAAISGLTDNTTYYFRTAASNGIGTSYGDMKLFSASNLLRWSKTYGGTGAEEGRSVLQTSDGGYIVAGSTNSSGAGSSDVYLVKTDASGNELWSKTYGGTGEEGGGAVRQTSDGGYIVAGSTSSFGAGSSDVYLVKTDASGNELWSKTYGGAGGDCGNSVQVTPDGGYIVAGYTESFGAGSSDVYLVKTDAGGNELWSKTYGSTGKDRGNSVQVTPDGGYIIAGYTDFSDAGFLDVYLVKTDASGNELWSKTYDGILDEYAYSVQLTTDGGYIVAGSSTFYNYYMSYYLIKTDADGVEQWSKSYYDHLVLTLCYDVKATSDGGYVMTGILLSRYTPEKWVFLQKMDKDGNNSWGNTFGGIETGEINGYSVQQTSDGGYIVAGCIETGDGVSTSREVYLIKTDGNGNIE